MRLTRRHFIHTSAVVATNTLLPHALISAAGRKLKAGVAKRSITPPLWIPYLTSSGNGTNAPFKGRHCDLFAKAVVFNDGGNAIALLAVDSIGYDNTILGPRRHFTTELRRKIAARTGLRAEAIMLTATHAHSTPETIGLTPIRDVPNVSESLENHLSELADTVIDAWKNQTVVDLFFGKRRVEGVARNRRILLKNGKQSRYGPLPATDDVAGPWFIDEELSVSYLQKSDGSPHSVLLNFTAHPVVSMLLPEICADFPGAAATFLEKKLPGAVCLFTNGAAGNVNSVHVSTNYDDVDVLGERLGRAALDEIGKLRRSIPFEQTSVASRSMQVPLKPRPAPDLIEAEQTMWAHPTAVNQRLFRLAKKLKEDFLQAEVQLMRVGPLRWISLPGEPFVETGLALKRAGADFVVGYANGWHGYFPLKRSYAEGGYEVDIGAWSRVAPGTAEQLENAAKRLLVLG